MFIANITVKIMELQKPRQTLRLQQLILDQIQTDHQTHTGLRLENRQWRNNPGPWAIPFTEFVAGGITMTRTGSQASGTWHGDSGTISLTGYTASCATNESWVSSVSGSAIAVGR